MANIVAAYDQQWPISEGTNLRNTHDLIDFGLCSGLYLQNNFRFSQ